MTIKEALEFFETRLNETSLIDLSQNVEGLELATIIMLLISERLGISPQIAEATGFYDEIIRAIAAGAVLAETGHLSAKDRGKMLFSQEQLKAVEKSILDQFEERERERRESRRKHVVEAAKKHRAECKNPNCGARGVIAELLGETPPDAIVQ